MSSLFLLNQVNIRSISSSTVCHHCVCTFIRCLSSKDNKDAKKNVTKYKDSVLLPKTEFPLWLDSRQRVQHDTNILKERGLSALYNWQRSNVKGKEFVLHDGPPYANGSPHVGHAVNKILKDVIMRHELLKGHCIHYVPGWDCHGLPIELKAVGNNKAEGTLSPLEIRHKAREFADKAIETQKQIFRSWGILGDWDSNCYFTYDKSYVQNQLREFYRLFKKGYVYRDMKPIYYSPSSRTALAESELEYNKCHKSTCVTLRVTLLTKPFNVEIEGPLYALVWTTTPWTLPANEAINYKSDMEYSIVSIDQLDGHYLLATKLVSELQKSLSRDVKIVQSISGRSLRRVTYRHPLYKQEVHKFFHADHVTDDKGTGLVHCAPSHGKEDYIVAIQNNLKLVSLVDKEGNYAETAGPELHGKSIMSDGPRAIFELLKNDIIHSEEIQHSYPYDWRTNQPVILMASEQWFFNCSAVKDDALNLLQAVTYIPDHSRGKAFAKLVNERPFWCISRQRTWGVPVPVLFERGCKNPIISEELIENYCDLIEKHGIDFWWTLPMETICPPSLATKLGIEINEVERCQDILDIWFDSGLSWSAVLEDRIADVYLEGEDQLNGWFLSSLLTSVALRGKVPFRKVFTHGFVVDGKGLKMSKSVGNVIDPFVITCGGKNVEKEPAFGVDTLRWWVAAHSVQHASIPISMKLVKSSSEVVQKLRGTIRYALGVLHDYPSELLQGSSAQNLFVLDQYMLHVLTELQGKIEEFYADHKYNLVCSSIIDFVVNDVSNLYITVTKDRLFCDDASSERRRACQTTFYYILETLLYLIAPLTPFLVEEAYQYHPIYQGERRFFEYRSGNPPQFPREWLNSSAANSIEAALEIKKVLSKLSNGKRTWGSRATVLASSEKFDLLKPLMTTHPNDELQLTEILQVGCVAVSPLDDNVPQESEVKVNIEPLNTILCARCHRFGCIEGFHVCNRCLNVLDSNLKGLKDSIHVV